VELLLEGKGVEDSGGREGRKDEEEEERSLFSLSV